MNLTLVSKITLSTLIISGSFVAFTSSASAFTFKLLGTFEDNGTLSGSFDYDGTNYSNINITTTGGNDNTSGNLVPVGTTYDNTDYLSGDAVTGFSISNNDLNFDLDLVFETDISTTPQVINLDSSTFEIDHANSGNTRSLSSGTVTPVPFEPSANLAILTIAGLMGVNHYRKKFQS